MDLGPSTDELQDVTKNGFMVAIRPTNYSERYTAGAASAPEQIEALFNRLDNSGATVSLMIGSGKQMLGIGEMTHIGGNLPLQIFFAVRPANCRQRPVIQGHQR